MPPGESSLELPETQSYGEYDAGSEVQNSHKKEAPFSGLILVDKLHSGDNTVIYLANKNGEQYIFKVRNEEVEFFSESQNKLESIMTFLDEDEVKSTDEALHQKLITITQDGINEEYIELEKGMVVELLTYLEGTSVNAIKDPIPYEEVCASMQNVFKQLKQLARNPNPLGSYHGDISIYQIINHNGQWVLLDLETVLLDYRPRFSNLTYSAPEMAFLPDADNPEKSVFYYRPGQSSKEQEEKYRLETHQADVYALGATLARALLGEAEFHACLNLDSALPSLNRNKVFDALKRRKVPKEKAMYIRKMLNPISPEARMSQKSLNGESRPLSPSEDYDAIMRVFAPST